MDLIVTTESQLVSIIENTIGKFLKVEPQRVEPDNLPSCKEAVRFLCENGYEVSLSLFNKSTARGLIPCKRFHNKRLLFSKKELIAWAESKCEPIGQSDAALQLAKSANKKLGGHRR